MRSKIELKKAIDSLLAARKAVGLKLKEARLHWRAAWFPVWQANWGSRSTDFKIRNHPFL